MSSCCRYSIFGVDPIEKLLKLPVDAQGSDIDLKLLPTYYVYHSLIIAQGPLLWSAVQYSWSLQCALQLQGQQSTFNSFVAAWLAKLGSWCSHVGCIAPSKDTSVIIWQLVNWLAYQKMFQLGRRPK